MGNPAYQYSDYCVPDPPHQPMYLKLMVDCLRAEASITNILDAGCGDGNFAASLAGSGFVLRGIDMSVGGIARASAAYPKIPFKVASVYDDLTTVFGDCTLYDAIVSIEVIEHLYSPRLFLQRAVDALRPGGLLILTTPYWGYLKNIALSVTNRMDRALTVLWDGGHIKHFSYRTMRNIVKPFPLEFVEFRGAGRPIPYLWNGMMVVFKRKT